MIGWYSWLFWGRFKYIPVTLVLGVLPRKTPDKPTIPSNPPGRITFLTLGERAKSKEERIRTQALALFLAFDFELSLDFLHKRET